MQLHDLLSDARYFCDGRRLFVRLDPSSAPAHIFRLRRRARSEHDFDYFVCSHGMLGRKADVAANIRYREELRDAVSRAIAAGQTLEQAQASVLMESYKSWEFYEQQRPANVAGTYRALMGGR